MQHRTKYENELMGKLERQGYVCVRSAGSHGYADLVAIDAFWVRVIQVKSTIALDRPGNVTVFADAIMGLFHVPIGRATVALELWVRVLRGGWWKLDVTDMQRDRVQVVKVLQGNFWTHWKD